MGSINIVVNNLNPTDLEQLCGLIQNNMKVDIILEKHQDRDISRQLYLVDTLIKVGMSSKLKGYQYLKVAIKRCVSNDGILDSVTKEVYPEIALLYNTSSSKVEHAIRHAIKKAWENGNPEIQQEVFRTSVLENPCNPSNSEFIARIADYILLNQISVGITS